MSSLSVRVTRTATAAVCGTLLAVGVVTAALLHVSARKALDRSLLAAAYAEAHPWQEERFANDYVRSPVRVRPWREGDPLVSAALHAEAIAGERPIYRTLQGRRVLLLVVEPEEAGAGREEDHPHFVVVADAPSVGWGESVLPFALIYGVVSAVAAVGAAVAVRSGMARALRPLGDAAAALQRVQGLGSGARVPRAEVDEVDALLSSANELLDRLDRAFDAQAGFTAQAAHELRTPVTVMQGELELALRRDRTAPDYREALARALREAKALAELVDGLMALTRVEAGHADRGREREHVSQVVLRAVERERGRLEAAGNPLSVDVAYDPEVQVHLALMATAVGNLLRNAAVHAAGTPVAVRTAAEDGGVAIVVEDGGPGVAPEDRGRVLERFGRRGEGEGLGLGLALVQAVAVRHGGALRLEEAPGGGLRAVVAFPEG